MATVGTLDAASMAVIGKQLRLMYADIIAEGVPERFAQILRRLPARSASGSAAPPRTQALPHIC
jgi:hypothetical protein